MSDDLLPCPFCGAEQDDHGDLNDDAFFCKSSSGMLAIGCSNCMCVGAEGSTRAKAIAAWNRRALPATDAPGFYEIDLGPGGTITVGEGGHFTVKTIGGKTVVSAERCVIRGAGEPATDAREAALLQRAAQLAYEVWDDPEALAKAILALIDEART